LGLKELKGLHNEFGFTAEMLKDLFVEGHKK